MDHIGIAANFEDVWRELIAGYTSKISNNDNPRLESQLLSSQMMHLEVSERFRECFFINLSQKFFLDFWTNSSKQGCKDEVAKTASDFPCLLVDINLLKARRNHIRDDDDFEIPEESSQSIDLPIEAVDERKSNLAAEGKSNLTAEGKSNLTAEGKSNLAAEEKSLSSKKDYNLEFSTARQAFDADKRNSGILKKKLGAGRGGSVSSKFSTPVLQDQLHESALRFGQADELYRNLDPNMVIMIENEILSKELKVTWGDIAGLRFVKDMIKEIVVWPMLRPDIFFGLRGPPKGLLLFGPPGTGKTLIGKCIATESKSTFFSISASSLTSKWIGEGEKMVKCLFAVARVRQPSVIFIDEIDSLLSQRSQDEHESSRRIKTEFLVQLDGTSTAAEDRILIIGATNRPQEIDEAARRRFVKRLYVPLPKRDARSQIISHLLVRQKHSLTAEETDNISSKCEGYSGADMASLTKEAAYGPVRDLPFSEIQSITLDKLAPIEHEHFLDALTRVKPSVSLNDLDEYLKWNKEYGSWQVEDNGKLP